MKKYLFLAIAALGFAACSDSDLNGGKDPIHKGEIEESYIAINLSASDITRADDGYHDGTEAERKVHHADFFFFDGDGNPFNVNVSGTTDNEWTEGTGAVRNHLKVTTIDWTKDEDEDDISDSAAPVLLLRTYKGEYPSQIVAVLNWSPDPNTAYSLEALRSNMDNIIVSPCQEFDEKEYFVMSNAVYAQNGTAVYATALTIDNIKATAEEANAAPVTIYVERVAAKVTVTSAEKFDINKDYAVEAGKDNTVYAKILGWELFNDNNKSYLLKNIDPTWVDDTLGFVWNDTPWYRSFWATSLPVAADAIGSSNYNLKSGQHTYIGENTTGKDSCTKAIIKAKFVNAEDQELEIALWNNVEYVGELALLTAVANTLKNTFYAKTTDSNGAEVYTGILPEDLQCVAGGSEGAPTNVAANEVYFQLSTTGKAKSWYKYVNGEFIPVPDDYNIDETGADGVNETLINNVPSAVLYKDGETLYYVDIKHLALENDKTGSYGIVRNHSYNITINSIKGYGSPVYEGDKIINYPTTPDQQTYVSAKINILSWRLVNQGVDIQPQN